MWKISYLTDLLGSIRFVTTSTGSITFSSDYKPFGQEYNPSGSNSFFMYTGKYYDSLTGMYYYNARFYDPAIERFISEDSYTGQSNQPQSLNRYSYVEDNPETFTDPTGHVGFVTWLFVYDTGAFAWFLYTLFLSIGGWQLVGIEGFWKTLSIITTFASEAGGMTWDFVTLAEDIQSGQIWGWGFAYTVASVIWDLFFALLTNADWWQYLAFVADMGATIWDGVAEAQWAFAIIGDPIFIAVFLYQAQSQYYSDGAEWWSAPWWWPWSWI